MSCLNGVHVNLRSKKKNSVILKRQKTVLVWFGSLRPSQQLWERKSISSKLSFQSYRLLLYVYMSCMSI